MADPAILAKTLKLIEQHLRQPLSVQEMADHCGYSLYHFCRVFNQHVFHSPYDYLLRRRLSSAVTDVLQTRRKIIDIAFDYQFSTHEGFTRAFQRMFRSTPIKARKSGEVDRFRMLPELTLQHLEHIQEQAGLAPEIRGLSEQRLSGYMTRVTALDQQQLTQDLPGLREEEPLRVIYYHGWQPAYLFCADSEGLVDQNILAGEFAIFAHKGGLETLSLTQDWLLHSWLFYAAFELREGYFLLEKCADGYLVKLPVSSLQNSNLAAAS